MNCLRNIIFEYSEILTSVPSYNFLYTFQIIGEIFAVPSWKNIEDIREPDGP